MFKKKGVKMAGAEPASTKNRLSLSFDLRIIVLLLIAVIAGMLFVWKPWTNSGTSDRTIEVTGESKISAVPDEYGFYPSYEFKNADKTMALADLTKKSDEVTAKLKDLGVKDNKIKTNSSGYDFPVYYDTGRDATYTLQFTIFVDNKELAQKIQDYLVTTVPIGSVSPQANFSDSKRKELESKGRDAAAKEARAKADQSGKNLGFKVGKVKSLNDSSNLNGGCGFSGLCAASSLDSVKASDTPSLTVQPGENELSYSVTVVYYIH